MMSLFKFDKCISLGGNYIFQSRPEAAAEMQDLDNVVKSKTEKMLKKINK